MVPMARAKGVTIRKDDTRRMEEEAKQMEAKLELLRRTMDVAEQSGKSPDGRWKSGSSSKPLTKGYVRSVLEAPKPKKSNDQKQEKPEAKSPASEAASASPMTQLLSGRQTEAKGAAASNLKAAMQHQDRDALEVEAFLCSLKLDRYVSLFMEHGFDCMDVVKEMEEQHMQQIGMAAGHILKLRRRLAEMKPNQAKRVEPSRKVSFSSEVAQQASPPERASQEAGFSMNLLEGNFNEEDSAASFQEALQAWRQGAKPADSLEKVPAAKASVGSFWTMLGGSEVNLERASTPGKLPAESQSAETSNTALGEEKLCCYQCFKQFYAQYAVERPDPSAAGGMKKLCSEACGDTWLSAMETKMEALKKRQQQLQQIQEMERVALEDAAEAQIPAS
eukprot:s1889_g8.t1